MPRTDTDDGELVAIRRRMNDHGTMTVEVVASNETRHLVRYGTAQLRETLAALPSGSSVPLRMEKVGTRANVWRASELCAESQDGDSGAASAASIR